MGGSLRVFGAPGRYVQGAGALDAMGDYVARVASRAALVADRIVLEIAGSRIRAACERAGVVCEPVEFSGEITPEEVERVTSVVRPLGADMVIACGGGKGIDAGKGAAHQLSLRVATVPTAASTWAISSGRWRAATSRRPCVSSSSAWQGAERPQERADRMAGKSVLVVGADGFVGRTSRATLSRAVIGSPAWAHRCRWTWCPIWLGARGWCGLRRGPGRNRSCVRRRSGRRGRVRPRAWSTRDERRPDPARAWLRPGVRPRSAVADCLVAR